MENGVYQIDDIADDLLCRLYPITDVYHARNEKLKSVIIMSEIATGIFLISNEEKEEEKRIREIVKSSRLRSLERIFFSGDASIC